MYVSTEKYGYTRKDNYKETQRCVIMSKILMAKSSNLRNRLTEKLTEFVSVSEAHDTELQAGR